MSLDGDEWKDIAVGVGFVEIVKQSSHTDC